MLTLELIRVFCRLPNSESFQRKKCLEEPNLVTKKTENGRTDEKSLCVEYLPSVESVNG